MLSTLDHLTILVRDIDRAIASYQHLLGAAPTWRGSHPEAGTHAALFALSNSLIELSGPAPDAAQSIETEALREHLASHGEGLSTLSFGTPDAAAISKTLRERGLRATPAQDGQALGSDGRPRSYRLVELSPRATRGLPISIVERADSLFSDRQVGPAACDALDHVVVRSADLAAAKALYGAGLGLRLALETELMGVGMLFFRVGGVTLEVIHEPSLGANDLLHGLAYRVRDLAAARSRMQAAGIEVSELRAGRKPGTEVFSVRDGSCGVPTLVLRDPARD